MIPPITPPPLPADPAAFSSAAGVGGPQGAGLGSLGGLGAGTPATGAGASFAQELNGALRQMEQLQTSADRQVGNLISGHNEDVHSAMIAVEKSDLAFGMMLQLRNKAVEAYQDISHMTF